MSWQLLDISELDMVGAGREAKRRRKTLGAWPGSRPGSRPRRAVGLPVLPSWRSVSRLPGAFCVSAWSVLAEEVTAVAALFPRLHFALCP